MRRLRLQVEPLEARDTPTAVLSHGTLTFNAFSHSQLGTHPYGLTVFRDGDQIRATERVEGSFIGPIPWAFDAQDVKRLVIHGAMKNVNNLVNNTDLPSWITGGNLVDSISGGSNFNLISTGKGNDYVNLNGGVTILYGFQGRDSIYITPGTYVVAGPHDKIFQV